LEVLTLSFWEWKSGTKGTYYIIYFDKNNEVSVNNTAVKKEDLQNYYDKLLSDKPNKFIFCFAKDLTYGNYIQDKIFIQSLKFPLPVLNLMNEEFIY
jgi:biopolymer transport protein ExbD